MLIILWLACAPAARWEVDALGAPTATLDEGVVNPVDGGAEPDDVRTVRRRTYALAREGSSRALHNAAVDAERSGRLSEALDLAREAYVARPCPYGMAYVEELSGVVATTRDATADDR